MRSMTRPLRSMRATISPIFAHGVGLNHDEGLLDSHKVAFQVGSRVPKSHSGTRLDCIVTEF